MFSFASFFTTPKLSPPALSVSDIVKLLIKSRGSNYSNLDEVPDLVLPEIRKFVLSLGNKIINNQVLTIEEKELAKNNYADALHLLFTENKKFMAIQFSAQLLQYYTFICQKESLKNMDTREFYEALEQSLDKIGPTHNNLFIIEYKLIKIFNDLSCYQQAMQGLIAPTCDMSAKKDFLFTKLSELSPLLISLKKNEPDNVYCLYLNFALQYSNALALELDFSEKQSHLTLEEKLLFEETQKIFLQDAYENLESIGVLLEQQK